ncbi:MAG: GNAT family N-acetyltransferase [Bacteroidota bacterium]
MSADPEQKQEYTNLRVSPETIPDLITIAQSAFGVQLNENTLRRKFDTQFTGAAYLGIIARSQDNFPSAYYGVFPVKVLIDNRSYLVAQSGDTMTHKVHQGKGLFVKLAKETYRLAAENGIPLVFGFPNSNSYPGFVKKLDWKHDVDLTKFSKKIYTLPMAGIAAKYGWVGNCYRSFLSKRLRTRDYFQSSIIASGQNGVERGLDYWNYKGYSPNFTFNAAGVKVWAKIDGVLQIGDIEYKESVDYEKVLKKIARRALLWGCHKIVFQCNNDTWLATILSKSYSSEKGLPVGYVCLTENFPASELKFTMADFDTF